MINFVFMKYIYMSPSVHVYLCSGMFQTLVADLILYATTGA